MKIFPILLRARVIGNQKIIKILKNNQKLPSISIYVSSLKWIASELTIYTTFGSDY